jgi:hypothetical protein
MQGNGDGLVGWGGGGNGEEQRVGLGEGEIGRDRGGVGGWVKHVFIFSKVLYIVTLISNCLRALTFQNVCQLRVGKKKVLCIVTL